MARRIDEHHAAIIHLHFIRTDVLRDSAGLTCRHVFAANGIQQAGLPMVDVSHHRDHRRPRLQTLFGLFFRNLQHHLLFQGDHTHHAAERFGQCRCCRHIQRLVDAGKDATIQQRFQQFFRAHVQLFR